MKRILWVNPSFLDYRIPLYKCLNNSLHGQFYLIYARPFIPERCHKKIQNILGNNAIALENLKKCSLGNVNGFANKGVEVVYPKGLYSKISSVKPDLIIAEGFFKFTPWAVVYSFVHRIPLLIAYERTAHTERYAPWWRKLYRKFVDLFVDGYIVNGSLTKEYLVSQGANSNCIFTGGMCADSEALASAVKNMTLTEKCELNNALGKRSGGLTYLFVGQLIERKGVRYLISAWKDHVKQYPLDMLILIGDGDQRKELEEMSVCCDSIKFLGALDYSFVSRYYGIADVFILPTLEDNWSLVVPEAMACGLPVATSIYNGCYPELVKKDENGYVFDPLDAKSILLALDYFHKVDLEAFGENSKKVESNFNPKSTAKNIVDAITTFVDLNY